jgi:hypothetical protein
MTYSFLPVMKKRALWSPRRRPDRSASGGWVIRGASGGLVASQGTAPSTFWRDAVLRRMEDGEAAIAAVAESRAPIPRGTASLPRSILAGRDGGVHRRGASVAYAAPGSDGMIVAGNMLSNPRFWRHAGGWTGRGGDDPALRALAAL